MRPWLQSHTTHTIYNRNVSPPPHTQYTLNLSLFLLLLTQKRCLFPSNNPFFFLFLKPSLPNVLLRLGRIIFLTLEALRGVVLLHSKTRSLFPSNHRFFFLFLKPSLPKGSVTNRKNHLLDPIAATREDGPYEGYSKGENHISLAPIKYTDVVYQGKPEHIVKMGCTDYMLTQFCLKNLIDGELAYYPNLGVFMKDIFER